MTREHAPCGRCARFLAAARRKDEEGPGHCEDFGRPAQPDDQPCVLFNERGSWEVRKSEQPGKRDHFARERTNRST